MIDGHTHLFHSKVIANVGKRADLVQRIRLHTDGAQQRIGTTPLAASLRKSKIRACLVLPTALAPDVGNVNDTLYETLHASNLLYPAGTLHPDFDGNRSEPWFVHDNEIKTISRLLKQAGFNEHQRELVFSANMSDLMGI
jgi:hypothetical protein